MLNIEIPLSLNQIAVVLTANLMLETPCNLTVEKKNDTFILVLTNENEGFAIIHKIQDMLTHCGFDKEYQPTSFGGICESIIDVFGKYGELS